MGIFVRLIAEALELAEISLSRCSGHWCTQEGFPSTGYPGNPGEEEVCVPYFRVLRVAVLLCLVSTLLSCGDPPTQATSNEPRRSNEPAWFQATITGAYEAEVSGKGVLVFLPDAGFEKQGYFFLADGQGVRPHGVTFILPRGITSGKYPLESLLPLAIGTVPSVRVDRDQGDSVTSADKNISGFLELDAFPTKEQKLSGSELKGSFEFETAYSNGETIKVMGDFSFKAE